MSKNSKILFSKWGNGSGAKDGNRLATLITINSQFETIIFPFISFLKKRKR